MAHPQERPGTGHYGPDYLEIVTRKPARLNALGKTVLTVVGCTFGAVVGVLSASAAVNAYGNGGNHWAASTGGWDFAKRLALGQNDRTATDLGTMEMSVNGAQLTAEQREDLLAAYALEKQGKNDEAVALLEKSGNRGDALAFRGRAQSKREIAALQKAHK